MKFQNFLALTRETLKKRFLAQARSKNGRFFLLFFSFFTHNAPIYDTNKFQQNKNVHIYVLKNWLGPPVNFGLRTGLPSSGLIRVLLWILCRV